MHPLSRLSKYTKENTIIAYTVGTRISNICDAIIRKDVIIKDPYTHACRCCLNNEYIFRFQFIGPAVESLQSAMFWEVSVQAVSTLYQK